MLIVVRSLAIESQLANLDDAADTIVSLNDDFFILQVRPSLAIPESELTKCSSQDLFVCDVSSPLTGPVFRMQRDLLVSGVAPKDIRADPDGEWRGLGYTNWLLSSSLFSLEGRQLTPLRAYISDLGPGRDRTSFMRPSHFRCRCCEKCGTSSSTS